MFLDVCFLLSSYYFILSIFNSSDSIVVTKCYPDVGCFSTGGEFWHIEHRPLSVLPRGPDEIAPKFLFYTRKNKHQPDTLTYKDDTMIKSSHFDAKQPTKFIVHGFLDNQLIDQLIGKWMRTLKDEFLIHDNYNVFIVDWSKGNFLPYTQAAANTR